MAAYLQKRGFSNVGRRFIQGNWIASVRDPAPAPFSTFRRGTHHSSVYDKNLDDQVRPTIVPNDVIEAQSDKYWAPHPQTGVFGPPDHDNLFGRGLRSSLEPPPSGSVLEQKVWFRPLEDVDNPHHHV